MMMLISLLKNTHLKFIICLVIFVLADIDECSDGSDKCHDNADCENIKGNYTCSCKSGFSGNGFSCTREDSISI